MKRLPKVLDQLRPEEAQVVLREFLTRRPELRSEAASLAEELIRDVDPEHVARDVQAVLRRLDLDELNGRAGRMRFGYVEPAEAAWEILQEAVEPFLAELRRSVELGLDEAAVAVCSGIVLGLYQASESQECDLLVLAADFPAETAFQASENLAGKSRQRRLPGEILDRVPTWGPGLRRITG